MVDKTGPCWNWLGATSDFGHGVVRRNYILHRSHRLVWETERGEIPEGLCVLHRCDNPRCVNPEHLFLGTKKDNSQDMVSKGRARNNPTHGENSPHHKLTQLQVEEIRRRYGPGRGKGRPGPITQSQLASEYGVSQLLISKIVRNLAWK